MEDTEIIDEYKVIVVKCKTENTSKVIEYYANDDWEFSEIISKDEDYLKFSKSC